MKYEITDGTLTFGARCILSHVQFAIRGTEKIALVGPNGAGKNHPSAGDRRGAFSGCGRPGGRGRASSQIGI